VETNTKNTTKEEAQAQAEIDQNEYISFFE
jgi:hypothetical protein